MGAGDSRLYNELDATLENRRESNDVLCAYRITVDLFPLYTRAWGNIVTECGNHNKCNTFVRYYLCRLAAPAHFDEDGRAGRSTRMDDMGHVWG